MTSRSGHLALERPHRRLHRPFGIVGGLADVVLVVGQAEQQHAGHAVGPCGRALPSTASSTESWNTPGIDATSRRCPSPRADEQRVDEHLGATAASRGRARGSPPTGAAAGDGEPGPRTGGLLAAMVMTRLPVRGSVRRAHRRDPGWCSAAACTVVDDPELLRGFGGDRADRRDHGAAQQVGRLFLAVDLREVPDRRRAGERHRVDLPVEQHPVDVAVRRAVRRAPASSGRRRRR